MLCALQSSELVLTPIGTAIIAVTQFQHTVTSGYSL